MRRIRTDKQQHKISWWLMFIMIHMSSGASVISLSDAALALCTVGTVAFFHYERLKYDRAFGVFTAIYVFIAVLQLIQWGWLNITATMRIYLKIIYGYCTIKIVGFYFFHYYEDIVYKLAAISIPLFFAQLAVPEVIRDANGVLGFIIPQVNKGPGAIYTNSIVYTVNPWGMERNSGFMWEPGGYAAMLSIAMFISLIINGWKIRWRFVCMLIAMLTTESTTGFLLILVIGVGIVLNTDRKYIVAAIPIMVFLIYFILSLDFVAKKIEERFNDRGRVLDSAEDQSEDRDAISVGRFGSFVLDAEDFAKKPIIGYGLQADGRKQNRYIRLVRVNGLSDYMVKFGTIGMLFLFIGLTKSFARLNYYKRFNGAFMIVPIICFMAFSNPVLVKPIFFAFQVYFLAITKRKAIASNLKPVPEWIK